MGEKSDKVPRVVVYHQTTHVDGQHVSVLPLLSQHSGVTHLIIAALHLNGGSSPHNIHLNDHPPESALFSKLWEEVAVMQSHGVKVMLLLGGAARGSYARLDASVPSFEENYALLSSVVRKRGIQGVDLDVEEHMSLAGIVRLIRRIRQDFGQSFIISLAPVAGAMRGRYNLSGFSYEDLEVRQCAGDIDFYNVQFYCGHGNLADTSTYEEILARGWPPYKLVVGSLTNWRNGSTGWLPITILKQTWARMQILATDEKGTIANAFGGVAGWEYFNSLPGGLESPWQWISIVSRVLVTDFRVAETTSPNR